MRILLLSFYYPPDIGPGSLRAKSIVTSLQKVSESSGIANLSIDVMTTLPNRYHSMIADAPDYELSDDATVYRFALSAHKSGMLDQSRAFVIYGRAVMQQIKGKRYDVVIATSSRLMTASLAAWLAKRLQAKLYLDIRDLFCDSIRDVLAKSPLRILSLAFKFIELWTFRKADRINVVSAGFLPHLKRVVPNKKPSVLTNGIDYEFLAGNFSHNCQNKLPLVVYAGNMGDGQGLHRVIPPIAQMLEGQSVFRLIGDGGRKLALVEALAKRGLQNVEVYSPVSRAALFKHYCEADVLFLHLNDYSAFRKVLPSKIFEYAATGKPILAGVAGYAANFLRRQLPGVEVFSPCDIAAMELGLKRLLDGPRSFDRTAFCESYLRDKIMGNMAHDILDLVNRRK